MKIKYPLELEITSYCSLQCISCINSSITSKHHIEESDFDMMLDYVFENRESILYLNLSGVGDIFLHPKIDRFLLKILKKFSGTGIDILISSKGTIIKESSLKILAEFLKHHIGINISVGIFSMEKQHYEAFTKVSGSFGKVMKFLILLKKYHISFSLELLMSKYSLTSVKKFEILCKKF
jgi:MoaA/NifB/PqqE/SkfB family radical SAM enzyme